MIAKTILLQLGGKCFAKITGSTEFIDMGNGLRMHLAKNNTSANYLNITYNKDTDLYTMEFIHKRLNKKTLEITISTIAKYEDVFSDMLQSIFTEVTGLYTHL